MSLKDHPMTELLKRAVHCHGGLARWEQLRTLVASMSITGAIWATKGQPDALVDIRVEAHLHTEHVVIHHFPGEKNSSSPHSELRRKQRAVSRSVPVITRGSLSKARRSSVPGTTYISAISAVTPSGRT